jgi:hypothetical protein
MAVTVPGDRREVFCERITVTAVSVEHRNDSENDQGDFVNGVAACQGAAAW